MIKRFFLFFFIINSLFAITFDELCKEPNSLAKDFYLYQMLQNKELNQEQIKTLRAHIYRFAGQIAKEYKAQAQAEKPKAPKDDSCWSTTAKSILTASKKCQKLRLSNFNFAKRLEPKNLLKIANEFAEQDKYFADKLRAFAHKEPAKAAQNTQNIALALELFYQSFALDDKPLDQKGLKSFLSSPHAYKFLNSALVDDKFAILRKSLLKAKNPPENIDADLAFAMGLNFIASQGDLKLAKAFFLRAAKNYKFKRPRDNALWFAYLAGRDIAVLEELAASTDLNIYSLYARQLLGKSDYEIIVPQPTNELKNEPISDALAQARWQIALKKATTEQLREWEQKYYARNTLGQYMAVRTRLYGFGENIYPLPFAEHLSAASADEKALIYALAMQESRFLPASVSTSYALGMMQFMPFVARHTAKADFGIKDFDVTKMFEPATALPFALAHVRTLKKGVSSPLFVAYAYNGGLGFTRRMLSKQQMFASTAGAAKLAQNGLSVGRGSGDKNGLSVGRGSADKNGLSVGRGKSAKGTPKSRAQKITREDFEPFLSMELVPYLESRLYGKKVLANYYVYKNLLGEKISMQQLFSALDKAADAKILEKNKEQK